MSARKTNSKKSSTARKTGAAKKSSTARKNGAARKTNSTPRKNATVRSPRVPAADVVGSFRLPPVFVDAAKLSGTVVKRNARAVYVKLSAAQLKAAKAAADKLAESDTATTGEVISARAASKALAKGPRK